MESLRKMTQASTRLQKPVLVLNASYEPINICAARRALVLVLKGIAAAEEVTSHAGPSPPPVPLVKSHRRGRGSDSPRRPLQPPLPARAQRDPVARIPPNPAPD